VKKAAKLISPATQEGFILSNTSGDLGQAIVPFMAVHGFLPSSHLVDRSNPFGREYKVEEIAYGGKAIIHGKECDVLRINNSDGELKQIENREIWIYEGNVVRIADYLTGSKAPDDVVTIEYESKSGVDYPSHFKRTRYEIGSGPDIVQQMIEFRVKGFELNPEYASKRKEFDLYPGMLWGDKQNTRGLVVDNDLQLVSVANDEIGKPSRKGKFSRWLFVSVILVFSLAVTIRVVSSFRIKQ